VGRSALDIAGLGLYAIGALVLVVRHARVGVRQTVRTWLGGKRS
jgi:hypothetical protein